MNPKIVNDLNEIALEIKARIQAYADLHNISFDEAAKRAKLRIGNEEFGVTDGQIQRITNRRDGEQ